MCPKRYGRRRKHPTLMTIRRGNGVRSALRRLPRMTRERVWRASPTAGENRHQLLWRNNFELGIGAVARLLVRAPPSKLRHVTETGALHVFVSDFHHQFGTQWLPRQVLALAPAALATRHAMRGFTACGFMLRPLSPRVCGER